MPSASLLPPPRSVFYNTDAEPLSGGLVYTYVPGGTVAATTWQDAYQLTPNSNPIVLDAAGSCLLYGSGNYQLTVTDATGNAIPAYSGETYAFGSSSTSQVYVRNFGAVGNGTTDDTAAIQAAINYAGANAPCQVLFDSLTYLITAKLTVGTGSSAGASSYSGVQLIGITTGWMPDQIIGGPNLPPTGTRLLWGGTQSPTSGPMIEVDGPIKAWGVSNIIFDADPNATFGVSVGAGLLVISGQWGMCENLVFRGCTTSIYSETMALSGQLVDAIYNSYNSIRIAVGWYNGANAIVLTGNTYGNTDFNTFTDVMIALPTVLGAGQVAYGLYLQACDSNRFYGVQFLNGASPYAAAVVFDYTLNGSFPNANQIQAPDWGGLNPPVLYIGTPSNNTSSNYILILSEANASKSPVNIPNLSCVWGVCTAYNNPTLTGNVSEYALKVAYSSGVYRVSVTAICSTGPANGGTIAFGIAWVDGTTGQGAQLCELGNTPGDFTSGSTVFYATATTVISYSATLSAAMTGLNVVLYIAIERLI
jgi:hypothetical protein